MIETPDIPRDELCKIVNPKLFTYFQIKMFRHTGNLAVPIWTEAEVVQWLDQVETVEINKVL